MQSLYSLLNTLGSREEFYLGGTGSRKKLCMVPCHSYYIYGTRRSKEVGEGFKMVELKEVLPKQTTCKMKTLQVQFYIQQ